MNFLKKLSGYRLIAAIKREPYAEDFVVSPGIRTVKAVDEISFGELGGTEYFFFDCDNDGKIEIITYQGPGVFGSRKYNKLEHIKPYMPPNTSISVFNIDGSLKWTWGVPNSSDKSYISHSYECCIDCCDIDNDGEMEILIADGDKVIMLEGKTGKLKKSCKLDEDNYYIVKALGEKTERNEAALVIKNGEEGYNNWNYGEPVIGLNGDLEIVWGPKPILGGGHQILAIQLPGEEKRNYLTGYSLISAAGEVIWTADSVDKENFDSDEMHTDYIDSYFNKNELLFAIAGSDTVYLINQKGETKFSVKSVHPQGALIGKFSDDAEYQIVCYNAPDGPLQLFSPEGKEIWAKKTFRNWPESFPDFITGRRYHRNRPIIKIPGETDSIGFVDGGWPWAVNGKGEIIFKFEQPENSLLYNEEIENINPRVRGDDIGLGFGMQCVDINNDGFKEVLIYNRSFLWVYVTNNIYNSK